MKHFQFEPASESGGGKFDHRSGLSPTGWTREDVQAAVVQHAQAFGPDRTARIAKTIMGDLTEPIEPRFYSALIAHFVYELAQRPFIKTATMQPQRKPYA